MSEALDATEVGGKALISGDWPAPVTTEDAAGIVLGAQFVVAGTSLVALRRGEDGIEIWGLEQVGWSEEEPTFRLVLPKKEPKE